jgi:nucleoside diphosphate kinase
MAVSLATGLLVSSALMLFVLPAIVLIVEDVRKLVGATPPEAAEEIPAESIGD